MWQPQFEYFSKTHQVITYDLRGFGQSSLPTQPYSHHNDLFQLLSFLGIKNAHLIGLSLGGEVAIDFTLNHPDFVTTLTLVDSSLGGFKSTLDRNLHIEEVGVEGAKVNWMNHAVFAASMMHENTKKLVSEIVNSYSGWHWLNPDPRERLSNPTAMELISEIQKKTLIMVGENDVQYFHDIGEYLHQNIQNSQKVLLPHSGHMSNLDNSEEFNTVLEKFLQ